MIASAWKVVSFQNATAVATLAAASAAAAVTTNSRASCPGVTPPNSPAIANIGTAAASSSSTRTRLAASLPSTSSPSEIRLTSSSSNVRRSFSLVTATAPVRAAASIARQSWSGPRILSSVAPNRAVSPAVATVLVPVTTSQQVAMMAKSAAA